MFREVLMTDKETLFFPDGKSSKGHKCYFEFDVWGFKQNPLPKDVSIEMIYDTVKLPLLRFYIATRPKSVLSDDESESDEDPDCDSFVSEPDLVPNSEQSTLEFAIERNNQLDLTDEPHDCISTLSKCTVTSNQRWSVECIKLSYRDEIKGSWKETCGNLIRKSLEDLWGSALALTSFTRRPIGRTCGMILQLLSWLLQWVQFHSREQHLDNGHCVGRNSDSESCWPDVLIFR